MSDYVQKQSPFVSSSSERELNDNHDLETSGSAGTTRFIDIIPGRVVLVTRGSSDVDEIAKRTWVESEFGLRLIPLKEVVENRIDTKVGD